LLNDDCEYSAASVQHYCNDALMDSAWTLVGHVRWPRARHWESTASYCIINRRAPVRCAL